MPSRHGILSCPVPTGMSPVDQYVADEPHSVERCASELTVPAGFWTESTFGATSCRESGVDNSRGGGRLIVGRLFGSPKRSDRQDRGNQKKPSFQVCEWRLKVEI